MNYSISRLQMIDVTVLTQSIWNAGIQPCSANTSVSSVATKKGFESSVTLHRNFSDKQEDLKTFGGR